MEKPVGNKENYMIISLIIYMSFFISSIAIIILNINHVDLFLSEYLGNLKLQIFKQYFYGTLGSTIACSIFFNQDKEMNELESLKEEPDYKILRYPTKEDIHLYVQRIISSGVLGTIGVLVLLAGFGYLDIDIEKLNLKHKLLFALFSFLIGLFQSKFYENLQSIMENMLKKNQN